MRASLPTYIRFLFLLIPYLIRAQYFTKVTTGALVSTAADSRSVNWVDVNKDGWVDCFISNGPTGGQNNFLYLNDGSGGFNAVSNDSIVLDNKPSDGATFADADNDGDIDAFVVNWYNVNNLFYLNNGAGQFTKINNQIISNDAGYSETAAWGDYDLDGRVDLYVTNSSGAKKNFLYHNDGNASFTKILPGAAVNDTYFSRSVNWTDIDNDGDPDLFVTNENNQHENIYRNDGNGIFTKLSTGSLLNNGGNTMSGSWSDFDNDGDMDVFLANDQGYNALFRNDGNFNFTKLSNDTTAKTPSNSFSSAWSDIDNDGDEDLVVTNAFGNTLLRNFLYINNGNGSFSRNSTDDLALDSDWSYGCAFGDYDNDGFQDLAIATCRFNNVDRPNLLFHNNGNTHNWVNIKLTGTWSNHSAIGARVYLKAVINGNAVWQMRELSAQSSYCGQNQLLAHFGLGDATFIDSIQIKWPSGLSEFYTQQTVKQTLSFTEGQGSFGITDHILSAEYKVALHPNPTGDSVQLTIYPAQTDDLTLRFFNAEGKEVYKHILPSGTDGLNLDCHSLGLKPGIYFLSIGKAHVFQVKKLIIK